MNTAVVRRPTRLVHPRLPRPFVLGAITVAFIAVIGYAQLTLGKIDLSPGETWHAIFGQGEPRAVRSVQSRRLPRLITGLCVGAALGVSGAAFQSISRNPLGSPDIIGFTAGAATAATAQILFFGGGVSATAAAALLGGIATAAAIYVLALRGRQVGGPRLILVGIGVAATLAAITDVLIVRADVHDTALVQQWNAGSLSGRGWPHALAALATVAILVPFMAVIARRLSLMEMGDDTAVGLGVAVERDRLAGIAVGVLLIGAATGLTGPIAFIALAAPHIARFAVRGPGVPVFGSMLVGAVLLAGADVVSQFADMGVRTPVGLVTGFLGGIYLMGLVTRLP
ncbi:FecCD family ABC transporter permease [Corynebacterium freneyi]|uniref:Iron complex transport system permease protein n=1 Tax=Corynebacterium freneyi TaxID=134034 RepID=A0ABS4U5N0_9CORY|nr:iron chelate uptake ABC transporter family permease subunit [Corynebacterium freneyi]MBP2331977.1 iron complex transport system permease protein [Corynebacterium freneyi]QXA53771.1 iron chelate uptake ABC transporter family permease subunit [Corynebacterium freneyi]UBI01824.1 iron chelate uptake ABC transporter family permease subunit [Corynebacterium freneyi]WJZ05908.1 Ferric enterobactin transport system permease protein FepG [Corynebacterium freneyi]